MWSDMRVKWLWCRGKDSSLPAHAVVGCSGRMILHNYCMELCRTSLWDPTRATIQDRWHLLDVLKGLHKFCFDEMSHFVMCKTNYNSNSGMRSITLFPPPPPTAKNLQQAALWYQPSYTTVYVCIWIVCFSWWPTCRQGHISSLTSARTPAPGLFNMSRLMSVCSVLADVICNLLHSSQRGRLLWLNTAG